MFDLSLTVPVRYIPAGKTTVVQRGLLIARRMLAVSRVVPSPVAPNSRTLHLHHRCVLALGMLLPREGVAVR
jgi:hypothetical protein